MRWFKHMTQTRSDERISALIDKCGMEGYGFYWAVLEIVANVMDKTDRCEVTYSLTTWSSMLLLHHNKVRYLLGNAEVTGLMSVRCVGSNWTVKVPNLLKYRDEWASRKVGTRELIGSNSGVTREQDTETETQIETEEIKAKAFMSGKPDDASFSENKIQTEAPKNSELKSQAREVLEFLNFKTGKKFRIDSDVNLKLIIARLKSGATVMQCRKVIAKKSMQWGADEHMAQYLRPKTLFGATNFEQYVGELVIINEDAQNVR